MLYYCAYTWHHGTTAEQVRKRFLELDAAGVNRSDTFRGWYGLVGGGSGFLVVEAENPRDVTAQLQPWMDLMSWDVRAIYALEREQVLQTMRETLQRSA